MRGYPRLIVLFPSILVAVKTKEEHEKLIEDNIKAMKIGFGLAIIIAAISVWCLL